MANLTPPELAEFAAWFETHAAERFDAAIDRDARGGALDGLAEAALRDFRKGNARGL